MGDSRGCTDRAHKGNVAKTHGRESISLTDSPRYVNSLRREEGYGTECEEGTKEED